MDANELAEARARYQGRLTCEVIEHKLEREFEGSRLTEIDLSGMKLKEVGDIFER